MNIALIGYGKMGKIVEEIALQRGHQIVVKIDLNSPLENLLLQPVDVAVEFTKPESAVGNILFCAKHQIPVVVGTTAWYDQFEKVEQAIKNHDASMLYASNFSIGVNVFFAVNLYLAKLMNVHQDYQASVEEIHHLQKIDAPSGTAVSLANDMLKELKNLTNWKLGEEKSPEVANFELPITSFRKENVPGTHCVKYESDIDVIEIKHEAFNRKGFATGAVVAAEFLNHKKGIFTMADVLKLTN